ncbi:uncharacterized protein KQ657_001822 [Scheffersomyces spartinae]|uniref:RRM domain-containing protein n=1 Tax=Scheffersomyces spartinae TaxID=45513 RepID=A0A9P7V738_9ASCO|nr:uncharacterized protein KQ657_001822 [Scheffersomyces spartinae]KAG7192421.1 hypothetical protein KQ657_001822 [Scheffersomyces spartinae]
MAKKQVQERTVEEIEQDLQLGSSSGSEDESGSEEGEELSEEEESDAEEQSEDDEAEIKGLEESKSVHSVNKTLVHNDKSKGSSKTKTKRGIIYIGRLPKGFEEKELNKYFSQFGTIINLKVSRNKRTGKSKHYGFIEFGDIEVAKTAAETMDNYLLFGHLLKCQVVDPAAANNKDYFENSHKRFKVVPWKKISKHNHDKPKSKEQWSTLVKKFEQSKKSKGAQLSEKGINYDLSSL